MSHLTITASHDEYSQSNEWGGYTVHKAKTGFVVSGWSRVQGDTTDYSRLVKYPAVLGGASYDESANLAAPHNDTMTIGEAIKHAHLDDHSTIRVIRAGHVVR